MNTNNNEENYFHKFVLSADSLPNQANIFPYFEFMDVGIRKIYHQLKKTSKKKSKELTAFQELWVQLNNEEKVNLYCRWVDILKKALEMEKNTSTKVDQKSVTIQDYVYLKKNKLFNAWDKKVAKLTPTHLLIIGSKKTREYELKQLQIRKSKNKENFSWVLHNVKKVGKILHCGVNNQNTFNEWFYSIKCNIDNQRTHYFLRNIKLERQNPGSFQLKFQQVKQGAKQEENESEPTPLNKTLTEIIIDQQMKSIDKDDEFCDFEEEHQINFSKSKHNYENGQNKRAVNQGELSPKDNPNIFKRLIPQYGSLLSFTDTPVNCPLIHCCPQYRIYELPTSEQNTSNLKFFTIFPYPKSLIFNAITSEVRGWNDDVDVLTVKTNISSQNTVLFYQKNKPQGILYRQRDFLYLRHCFQVSNLKQNNTFIVDKSIDSIHQPPFMTVVRAQKRLIWGLIQKQKDKECILIVEGWIKGGGYMNQVQNRDMTVKFMKKLMNINGFAKQLEFSSNSKGGLLFRESWKVDTERIQQNYQSSVKIIKDQNSVENNSESSEDHQEKQQILVEQKTKQKEEEKRQLEEFMKRTKEEDQQNMDQKQQMKSSDLFSDERLYNQFKPPAFDSEEKVIIPTSCFKVQHVIVPKQKPKKPRYFPHFRGHHLWKGQWEVIPAGGLAYVDEEKMKEQKKVLTYIIKRIGKNIFSGKGILNISLPVDIFCIESNIERLAMSFGFFPQSLEKAAQISQPEIQMKYILASGIPSSLIYMTMEKPFNPILGETFQCWVDQCPVYFEQISHHPPIAAFIMYGRGYRTFGCVEAKMDLSINSGTGNNEGVFTIQFDNGNTFHYTTPAGCLTGLTYGDRKLNLVGKSYYWTKSGLMAEITYNPGAKNKGFWGGNKGEGEEKLADYFQGYLKQYEPKQLKAIAYKQVDGKQIPIIPKSVPSSDPIKTYYKINGRWNKYLCCENEKIWDANQVRYFDITTEESPLPSHSNYRQDIVYRRLRNFVKSQDFKEVLEKKQREDRKLRALHGPPSNH